MGKHPNDLDDRWGGPVNLPRKKKKMFIPVACNWCHTVYDLANVKVTARYADATCFITPCCNRAADDRPFVGLPAFRRLDHTGGTGVSEIDEMGRKLREIDAKDVRYPYPAGSPPSCPQSLGVGVGAGFDGEGVPRPTRSSKEIVFLLRSAASGCAHASGRAEVLLL
jgi:hypothetical protein